MMRTIRDMRHVIGLALHEDAMLYETAIAAEVFGVDRSDLSPTGTWYELIACTPDGSPSPWLPGFPARGFAELARVDTVVVPSTNELDGQPDPALLAALRAALYRGEPGGIGTLPNFGLSCAIAIGFAVAAYLMAARAAARATVY